MLGAASDSAAGFVRESALVLGRWLSQAVRVGNGQCRARGQARAGQMTLGSEDLARPREDPLRPSI